MSKRVNIEYRWFRKPVINVSFFQFFSDGSVHEVSICWCTYETSEKLNNIGLRIKNHSIPYTVILFYYNIKGEIWRSKMKHRISPFLFFHNIYCGYQSLSYPPIHYHSDFHAMLISFNQEHFTHKIMQIGGEWKCKLQPISVSLNSLNCLKTCILQQCNAFPCYEQFYGFQSNKKQMSIC